MPAVSVLLAFHRVTPFLAPAVRSVLAQTERDLELILVDNGTGAGLAPFGTDGRDPRIRLMANASNQGIAAALNAAVAAARGEFVALMDYDDLARPRRLERQLALLRSDPRLGLVNCGVATIDGDGRVTGREFSLLEGGAQLCFSAYGTSVVSPVFTGRREVFLQNPHREAFCWGSDFDFLARAAEHWKLGGVPEVLHHYRRHPEQTSVRHDSGLVLNQCATRLLTARRRAGRTEEFASLAAEMARTPADKPVAEIYAHYARRSLAEGLSISAVYHARRLVVRRRDLRDGGTAGRIFFGALARNPARAPFLTRLFLGGPLRAHGLRDQAPGLPE